MAVKLHTVATITDENGSNVKQVALIVNDAAAVGAAIAGITGHADVGRAIQVIAGLVTAGAARWADSAQIEITPDSIRELFSDIPLVPPTDRQA